VTGRVPVGARPDRTAAGLYFDVSDVLPMVANAVTLSARSPRGEERTLRDTPHQAPRLTGKHLTDQ